MIRHIRQVLTRDEVAWLVERAQRVPFVDGRETNPGSTVKRNTQASHHDPATAEPATIVRDALFRHPDIRAFALPRQMARPTLARYEAGMAYGWHVDEALFPSNPPMRSDLSCTVWLSAPGDYDGGELTIQLGEQHLSWKGEAGDAILYPSTTIHQVAPVTRGVRLVGITWIQSWVADPFQRELLLQAEEAKRAILDGGDRERQLVLVESLRTNLFRLWSDA